MGLGPLGAAGFLALAPVGGVICSGGTSASGGGAGGSGLAGRAAGGPSVCGGGVASGSAGVGLAGLASGGLAGFAAGFASGGFFCACASRGTGTRTKATNAAHLAEDHSLRMSGGTLAENEGLSATYFGG